MSETLTSSESNETQNTSMGYTEVAETVADRSDAVVNIYRETLGRLRVSPFDFSDFLDLKLKENAIEEDMIIATSYNNDTFLIHLDTGEKIAFSLKELQEYVTTMILESTPQEQVEKRVQDINNAIEAIYNQNQGVLFDGEIDNEDTLESIEFGGDLYGKTLSELRELLNVESGKLHQIYSITGDTKKQQELIKKEIQFFAGVGDKYEGGARYFSLSEDEIQQKVGLLTQSMSINEVFDYIVGINAAIDENWRKSDMVNQINGKLIQALYTQTLERLQSENRPNSEFIQFAKIVTGRDIQKEVEKDGKRTQQERDIAIDDDYKAFDIACRALIFTMYRPGGVLENIKQEIVVEDEEVSDKTPSTVMQETLSELNTLAPETPDYGTQILADAGLDHLLGTTTPYAKLSFDDKISLGAVYRIGKIIKDSSPEELKDPAYISKEIGNTVQDSYDTLNESFGDAFDGFYGYFGGKDADDLGLSGELAEIFDIYQDINGNSGFWDWSDANQDRFGNISTIAVLGIGLIAGAIIFAPVLAAGTAATASSMLIAGAQAGAITGIASLAFSGQGYDTYYEAAIDSLTQVAADTASGAIFAWAGLSAIKALRIRFLTQKYSSWSKMPKIQQYLINNSPRNSIAPDLLFSKEAWTKMGLIDKGFIVSEVGVSGMIISPIIAKQVREMYAFDHFDSDMYKYVNGNIEKRI